MKYILDPGDDQEVVTFTDVHEAWKALDVASSSATLYLRKSAKEYQVYVAEHWYATNPDNLPTKILEV